jgi:hypothetical protein
VALRNSNAIDAFKCYSTIEETKVHNDYIYFLEDLNITLHELADKECEDECLEDEADLNYFCRQIVNN